MLVKITSDNPDFLSLIQKNPGTFEGIQVKPAKNGTVIGFISSRQEYHLVFQDTKYSFSDDMSNQIDFQSHCNPRVFLAMASEILRHALVEKDSWFDTEIPWLQSKVVDIDTAGFTHVLEIENIYSDSFSQARGFVLSKYFPEAKLTWKSGSLYSLRIETNESLHRLINLATLTCMYMGATNRQRWYLNRDLVRKYIRVMKNLSPVPYFVLYLFAKRCIRSQIDFDELKEELSSAFDGEVNLTWGNTQEMRLRAVSNLLQTDGVVLGDIIEVGCGEMDYPKRFINSMEEGATWYSNDKENYAHLVPIISKRKNRNNLKFIEDLWSLGPNTNSTVLMIEMIEHMPVKDAMDLFERILDDIRPARVIITTPNITFNRHFGFEEGREFRHDDHHFEFNQKRFDSFIYHATSKRSYEATMFGIGDKVDGDCITLGAELIFKP
jgi:hypothetical protein